MTMREDNFILAIGNENSPKMRTITEALKKRYWGYYEAVGSEDVAAAMYDKPSLQYRLVVMTGGFTWWRLGNEINKNRQSIPFISYMDAIYKPNTPPAVIIYEPNLRNADLIEDEVICSELAERKPNVQFARTEEELEELLTQWWNKVSWGEQEAESQTEVQAADQ